jgi:hypothetical protein
VFALAWSKRPALTGSQLVARVLATLDDRRASRDPSYGYGLLNGYRAVTAAVPLTAPNPIYSAAVPFAQRDQALAGSQLGAAPKPAATRAQPPGTYRVGGAPRLLAPRVLAGLAAAVGGLLALIALAVTAVVRRRRRRGQPPPPPPPVTVDDTGLRWHDIVQGSAE